MSRPGGKRLPLSIWGLSKELYLHTYVGGRPFKVGKIIRGQRLCLRLVWSPESSFIMALELHIWLLFACYQASIRFQTAAYFKAVNRGYPGSVVRAARPGVRLGEPERDAAAAGEQVDRPVSCRTSWGLPKLTNHNPRLIAKGAALFSAHSYLNLWRLWFKLVFFFNT